MECVPFKDVPNEAPFRFDKDGAIIRWVKSGFDATSYCAEGGGFCYVCPDPNRPCLLLPPLTTFIPARFGLDGCEPFFSGVHTGERWNGWACPYFPMEEVIKLRDWIAAWAADDEFEKVIVDDSGRVWIDARFQMAKGEQESGYLYEVKPEDHDGVPVYPVGAFSWIWAIAQEGE